MMPYRRSVLHPRMVDHIGEQYYPSRVRIERPTYGAQQLSGERPIVWVIVQDDIPAAIMAIVRLGEEWRNWRLEFPLEQVTHRISLQGLYPWIDATMRLITDQGEVHNIQARHLDSHNRMTRINTKVFQPEAEAGA